MRETLTEQLRKHGADPALVEQVDKMGSPLKEAIANRYGPETADKLESAVRTLTDPWYGKQGLAGKTIVDLIKNVPPTAGDGGDEDD
ncbi:hypothetical protein ACZ91_42565 [Streptomyces regensis]|nr:hypothetical protein ACZ91_42565 [Streptomyces regensis]